MKQPGECLTKNPSVPRAVGIICHFTAKKRQYYHLSHSLRMVLRMKTALAWVEAWTGALFLERTLRLHIWGRKASPWMAGPLLGTYSTDTEGLHNCMDAPSRCKVTPLQKLNTGDDPNAINTKCYKIFFGPSASKILTVNEHEVDWYVLTCNAVLLSKTAR